MITVCDIHEQAGHTCREPAHAVMFAGTDGHFAGTNYRYGQQILACLRHANDILDARRGTRNARWLTNETLPKLRLPHHNQVTPTVWGKPRERNRK